MPGSDARSLAENHDLLGDLEALKTTLEKIKADIVNIMRHDVTYDLSSLPDGVLGGEPIPPPRGWPCLILIPGHWYEIQALNPAEIRSAIEDIQARIALIERIVRG